MAKDDDDVDQDELLINVIEEGNAMLQNLQILNMQPQICLRYVNTSNKKGVTFCSKCDPFFIFLEKNI